MSTNREEILGMVNWIQDLNNRLIPLIEELKDIRDECSEFDLLELTDEERIGLPKSSKGLEDVVRSLYELNRLTNWHDGDSLTLEVEDFIDGLYLHLDPLYDYYEWVNEDGQIVCTLTYDAEADAWKAVDHTAGSNNIKIEYDAEARVWKTVDHITVTIDRMIDYDEIRDMVVALETTHGFVSKIGNPIDEDGE